MSDQRTKRKVTQIHMDAIAKDSGPVYGVRLIDSLPVGAMLQAMPSRDDLEKVRRVSERTVAGYEVLLSHYQNQEKELARLQAIEAAAREYLGCSVEFRAQWDRGGYIKTMAAARDLQTKEDTLRDLLGKGQG